MYIYSCNDSHISSLLTLLNVTRELDQIPFASVVILELSQDPAGLYYVSLKMQSNTSTVPITLVSVDINSCGQLCALGNFFDLSSQRMVASNLREYCSIENIVSPIITTREPDAGCVPANGTIHPLVQPKKGLTNLEVSLIIVCSILGGVILGLIIVIGLICYRNKIRKASF